MEPVPSFVAVDRLLKKNTARKIRISRAVLVIVRPRIPYAIGWRWAAL
jgi:hypothetical protein